MTYADLYDPGAPPEPQSPPPEPPDGTAPPDRRRPFDRATARLAVLALASGVALNIGIRGGPTNAVVVAGLTLAVVAFAVDREVWQTEARALMLLALVPAAFLAVRVSPWLVSANLAAAGGLTAAAICLSQSGTLLDTTPLRLVRRALSALDRAFIPGLGVLRPLVPQVSSTGAKRGLRLALALAITLPLVTIVAALLASADAVFAELVVPDVELGPAIGHLCLTALAAAGVVCAIAAARGDADDRVPPGRFGTLEVATMLGLATGVMALFAVAQLVAATSAGDRLIEEAGLTPAEYARSGFFQLCWATALLVGFLALVRALAAPGVLDRPGMRALAAAVPLLTLGLVVVSLRRMALYDEAFGLTMLRLWVVGAAVWMGLILLMIAARSLGLGAGRAWVLAGAAASAFVLIVGADVANPEAFVVRHNVDRAADGAELDAGYLAELSDDSVPAYADALRTAPRDLQAQLRADLACRVHREADGVATLNVSVAAAEDDEETLEAAAVGAC